MSEEPDTPALPDNVDPDTMELLDPLNGNSVVINDSTGNAVIWSAGMPTEPAMYHFASPTNGGFDTTWRFDCSNASVTVPVLDGETVVGFETVTKNLIFFIRQPDISADDALAAFNNYTAGQYSDAVQSAYTPILMQLAADFNAGLGEIIYP